MDTEVITLIKTLLKKMSNVNSKGKKLFLPCGERCDGLASHAGKSRNTPKRIMLQKPEQAPT